MRGRRPRLLEIVANDVPILQEIARSRSLPWYQIQRAQILLAVAAGEPIQQLAIRTQCDPSTIWRICRRYEGSGLPDLLAPPQRAGRPARISPPPAGSDRSIGLPGADRQGLAHHPLDEPGSGSTSRRRGDRPGHQRSGGPRHPPSSGSPATPHAVLADVPYRCSVQGTRREGPLVLHPCRAVGSAGLLGSLCR
jgi:Homeodomain-like domain